MHKINFDDLAKTYRASALGTLEEFIKINSVYDPSTIAEEKPYGNGVNEMLEAVRHMGLIFGFESKMIGGRAVELSFGSGEKLISVYAHADVVPATGNWTNPPFLPFVKNGKIYGRGSSDDKGPMIAAFFALKLLKDNGLINGYRVKLVVGGDEERGSSCLDYYFNEYHGEVPSYGVTPDADFPVVYGEKGISNFSSKFNVALDDVESIEAGVVPNAVIDKATVNFKKIDNSFLNFIKENNSEYKIDGSSVIFFGKSSHGSTPELGVNAAIIALQNLANFYRDEKLKTFVEKIKDTTGKSFNCFGESSNLGKTTFNIGILKYANGQLEYITNFRFPENVDASNSIRKYDEINGTNSTVISIAQPLLFEPNSFLIQTLLKTYAEHTHDYAAKPIFLGGGTYAKEAKNTVAFGATFPGENTHMHEPDEFMNIDNFYSCIAIYADAIYRLGTSKDESKI